MVEPSKNPAESNRKSWRGYLLVSFFSGLTLVIIIFYSYFNTYRVLTDSALQRRQSLSSLAAELMGQRLDHLIALGKFLVADLRFRHFISGGEWEEAMQIHKQVFETLPFVDRIILTDPSGVLKADLPEVASVKGKDFSYRDWYRGVSQEWKPYVSEVYRRTANPPRDVVAVAIPVWAKDRRVLGILVLQIRLSTFMEWSKTFNIGQNEYLYFVDQKGNVLAHPQYSSLTSIVNFSTVPSVQRVMKGESGVLIAVSPIDHVERVTGYSPVKDFGWGAVMAEPTRSVFNARDNTLKHLKIFYGLFLLSAVLSGIFILLFTKSRHQREHELKESESLYRRWLNESTDGIWDWNLVTDEVYLSPHFKQFLGYVDEELPGYGLIDHASSWEKIVHPEDLKLALAAFKAHTESNKLFKLPIRYYHKNGSIVWALCRGVAFKDKNGHYVRMLGTLTDITELIHVKEMNRLKDEFIDMVSHELRTPLTVIREGVSLFHDQVIGSLDVEQRGFLSSVDDNITLLTTLIDTMLDLSRIEAGQLQLKKERVGLAAFIRKVLADHQLLMGHRVTKVSLGKVPDVFVDSFRVQQIFSNLLANAIKFTKNTGTLQIKLETRDKFAVISIQDDGIGIAAKDIPKLFKKFSRIEENFSSGTGLGLALCKQLVEMHGGSIWVVSSPDKGSTFTFTLPM